jgi:hypothetical protein
MKPPSYIFNPSVAVIHVDGMRLCLWTAVTNGIIVHPADYIWIRNSGGIILTSKTEEVGDKPVPEPLHPS